MMIIMMNVVGTVTEIMVSADVAMVVLRQITECQERPNTRHQQHKYRNYYPYV